MKYRCLECGEILTVCAQVLSPDNENLKRGDVKACVRDVAQMAMAAKDTEAHEAVKCEACSGMIPADAELFTTDDDVDLCVSCWKALTEEEGQ